MSPYQPNPSCWPTADAGKFVHGCCLAQGLTGSLDSFQTLNVLLGITCWTVMDVWAAISISWVRSLRESNELIESASTHCIKVTCFVFCFCCSCCLSGMNKQNYFYKKTFFWGGGGDNCFIYKKNFVQCFDNYITTVSCFCYMHLLSLYLVTQALTNESHWWKSNYLGIKCGPEMLCIVLHLED